MPAACRKRRFPLPLDPAYSGLRKAVAQPYLTTSTGASELRMTSVATEPMNRDAKEP